MQDVGSLPYIFPLKLEVEFLFVCLEPETREKYD